MEISNLKAILCLLTLSTENVPVHALDQHLYNIITWPGVNDVRKVAQWRSSELDFDLSMAALMRAT